MFRYRSLPTRWSAPAFSRLAAPASSSSSFALLLSFSYSIKKGYSSFIDPCQSRCRAAPRFLSGLDVAPLTYFFLPPHGVKPFLSLFFLCCERLAFVHIFSSFPSPVLAMTFLWPLIRAVLLISVFMFFLPISPPLPRPYATCPAFIR